MPAMHSELTLLLCCPWAIAPPAIGPYSEDDEAAIAEPGNDEQETDEPAAEATGAEQLGIGAPDGVGNEETGIAAAAIPDPPIEGSAMEVPTIEEPAAAEPAIEGLAIERPAIDGPAIDGQAIGGTTIGEPAPF